MKLVLSPSGPVSGARGIHFGWYIVAMATVLQVTTNFLSQAFAILLVTVRDEFGWSLTAITLAYLFRQMVGALLAPFAGWVGDRYGGRRALLMGATLYVAGMLLLSSVDAAWQLYLYYSLILGAAQALFMVNIPTTVGCLVPETVGPGGRCPSSPPVGWERPSWRRP